MPIVSLYESITTLNVNTFFNQKCRMIKWLKKKTHLCAAYKNLTLAIGHMQLKSEKWKNLPLTNGNQKRAGDLYVYQAKQILNKNWPHETQKVIIK